MFALVLVLTVPEPPVVPAGWDTAAAPLGGVPQHQPHEQQQLVQVDNGGGGGGGDMDAGRGAYVHSGALSVAAADSPPTAREIVRYWCTSPVLLLLCLAGGVRNAGGYVFAYYAAPFFLGVRGVPPGTFAALMAWIPLLAGSCGAVLGGHVADAALRARPGDGSAAHRARVRLGVVVAGVSACVACTPSPLPMSICIRVCPPPSPPPRPVVPRVPAACCEPDAVRRSLPFAAAAVLLDDARGLALLPLLGASLFGEAWIGVTMTVLVELVAPRMRGTAVAVYLFIITNIAGNAPLLVPVLTAAHGMTVRATAAGSLRGGGDEACSSRRAHRGVFTPFRRRRCASCTWAPTSCLCRCSWAWCARCARAPPPRTTCHSCADHWLACACGAAATARAQHIYIHTQTHTLVQHGHTFSPDYFTAFIPAAFGSCCWFLCNSCSKSNLILPYYLIPKTFSA